MKMNSEDVRNEIDSSGFEIDPDHFGIILIGSFETYADDEDEDE